MRAPAGRELPRAADGARPRSFSGRKTVGVSATHSCSPRQELCELLARGPLWISLVVTCGHLLYVTIPKSVSNQTVHQTSPTFARARRCQRLPKRRVSLQGLIEVLEVLSNHPSRALSCCWS